MPRILEKLFGGGKVEDSIPAVPPTPVKSEARDEFYEDLRAQEAARRNALPFPEDADEMPEKERQKIAKSLVGEKIAFVAAPGTPNEVAAEDAAPAGEVFAGSVGDDGRFAGLWATYALINPRILRHFISRVFIGYPACTILGTHEIINPCCNMPGKDAIAPGYSLLCVSTSHKKDDEHIEAEGDWLTHMKLVADAMGMNEVCAKLSYYKRLYGIGIAIPRVEFKEGHSYEDEYNPSFIKPGSYKGISVLDPQRVTFDMGAETLYDPLSEYYMRPEYLRVWGRGDERIHRSWCIITLFCEVGDDLKATYMWGGVPLSQMLYERVFCADKLANECVALAMSKRTVVRDGNLKAMAADPNNTNNNIKRWNYYRNNHSVAFKEPGETITQLETSLSDLQPLSAQQYQFASAIAGIPVTKLMKNVPSGLQATGQYEQDEYEQTLKDIQETDFRPTLQRHYALYIASEYPDRADLMVSVKFNEIQLPKPNEVRSMESQRASMVCQLLMNNVISVAEGRAILRSGPASCFDILTADTPEIMAKIEEMKDPEKQAEMQQQMQGGGMQGAPGAEGATGGGQPGAEEPPRFAENKNVFQQALAEVMGGGGEAEGAAQNPPADAPSAEGGEQPAPTPPNAAEGAESA